MDLISPPVEGDWFKKDYLDRLTWQNQSEFTDFYILGQNYWCSIVFNCIFSS